MVTAHAAEQPEVWWAACLVGLLCSTAAEVAFESQACPILTRSSCHADPQHDMHH